MKQRVVWDTTLRLWVLVFSGIPTPYVKPRELVQFVIALNRENFPERFKRITS